MDSQAEIALANFEKDFDEFLIACNELEESGVWNASEMGPAAAYFQADVFGAILQVMRADGVFERPEAEVLNAMFGTSYTPRQLSELYHSIDPVLRSYLNEDADDALTMLKDLDPELADSYRNLLLEACRIVSLADGVAEKSERMLIAALREALA
ncbi:MAG: TerB family tellurite resistance protein [Coriobacteriales bacterium]|nr:TerB family tellurite resistance protein [Coriobacteriales bacterium]